MAFLGIDVGTSGCKATVIDLDGKVRAQFYKEYALIVKDEGFAELAPDLVFSSVCEVVQNTVAMAEGSEIHAICISSFGEAVIPVSCTGSALRNAMIYIDKRGTCEAEDFQRTFSNDRAVAIAGASIHPMYSLFKIMWMKKHEPDVYNKTWKFFLFADYILFRLGAKPHMDYSLAARTLAFNVVKKEWSREILTAAEIDIDKFPEPIQSGTIVGYLSDQYLKSFGLEGKIALVSGGHDQPCAALGAGAIKNGIAVDGLGTTECVTPSFQKPVISTAMASCGFACVPHVIKDIYVTYAFTFTSGALLKWFRNNFGTAYEQQAIMEKRNIYDVLIDRATHDIPDLFLLPHFAGAATPYMDTEAKGLLAGLTLSTSPNDIIQAILEGITFEMMQNIEKLSEAGVFIDDLRAVGGLAKSCTFLQMKSDMMGKKIASLKVSEAGTVGVAILGGTAIGAYRNINDAVKQLVTIDRVFEPNFDRTRVFRDKFLKYQRLYSAMKMIYAN
jgi:xylulokinase